MLGLGHHCCDMHDAIIPEVGPIFVDVQSLVLLLDLTLCLADGAPFPSHEPAHGLDLARCLRL